MGETLHIICCSSRPLGASEEGSDLAVAACVRELADEPSSRVILLANRRDQNRALSLGLIPHVAIAPPLGAPELSGPTLRRVLRDQPFQSRVVAWGPRAARTARLAGLSPQERSPEWWNLPRIDRGTPASRLEVRRSLGIDDDQIVFLGIAEPAGAFDAFFMLRMLSLLDVAGRRIVGLFPRGAAGFDRTRRFHRDVGLSMGVIVRDASWVEDAGWTDFAIIAPLNRPRRPRPAHTRIATALLQNGVPLMLEHTLAGTLGLGQSTDPCLITGRTAGHAALARRVLNVIDSSPQAPSLAIVREPEPREIAS